MATGFASKGMDIAMGSIFVLGIGLAVTVGITDTLNLTGIAATLIVFVPTIVIAGYIWNVWKTSQ